MMVVAKVVSVASSEAAASAHREASEGALVPFQVMAYPAAASSDLVGASASVEVASLVRAVVDTYKNYLLVKFTLPSK